MLCPALHWTWENTLISPQCLWPRLWFSCDSERHCCREKTGWQPDGHTGCLFGLVCVCCHNNCQAGMAEAWRRVVAATWFMDSEGGRAEQNFGSVAQKNQTGSIWCICKDSAVPATHNAPSWAALWFLLNSCIAKKDRKMFWAALTK